VLLLAWPASTVKVLAYLVGILFLIDGIIETVFAIVLITRKEKMGITLARGLIGLLIGILLLAKTGIALTLVVVLLAIWAIASGFIEFITAMELPPKSGRGLLFADGVLSVILGILLLALPLETVYAVIIIFCIFLLVGGVMNIVLAFYARSFKKKLLES
jgi:uncharacterized membrane protein HdeD (DUF308 family)